MGSDIMKFPKCGGCGNIITEDDCGAQTDEEGYTYCCGWSPSEQGFREDYEDDREAEQDFRDSQKWGQ